MVQSAPSGAGPWTWHHEDAEDSYEEALTLCLAEAEINQHFGQRGVDEQRVKEAARAAAFVGQALRTTQREYLAYRRSLSQLQRVGLRLAAARAARVVDTRIRVGVGLLAGVPVWLITNLCLHGRLSNLPLAVFAAGALVSFASCRWDPGARRHWDSVAAWCHAWSAHHACVGRLQARRRSWSHALTEQAMMPQLRVLVSQFLGPDQESLLLVGGHDGLRDAQNPKYVVSSTAERLLRQKMDQLDGGTIAVCGPRGAGKSTLLRSCSSRPGAGLDLDVFVQAPADYTPQDFLLTLFGRVCERYLEIYGESSDADVFAVAARRRRFWAGLGRAVRWVAVLVVAVALLVAGLWHPSLWVYTHDVKPRVVDHVDSWWTGTEHWALAFWRTRPLPAGVLLVATGLAVASYLERAPKGPPGLALRCQRYLYRLRTVQNSSTSVNLGFTGVQALTLGGSRSTSIGSRPLTYPELVSEFRDLLTDIARRHESLDGARVVIAIDELDRVGDTKQARKFLGEIKAVFGIHNVYYLISVAEDLGAAFVRRGLPHRDVTDSSLDDLLHVPPRTPAESKELLALRAPSLTLPFVQLLHALAGGLPRDLIRYARRLVEVHHWTERSERTDLAPAMICEELSDTLEGFRTLMAGQEWSAAGGRLLLGLQTLIQQLRTPAERNSPDTRARIRELADNPNALLPGSAGAPDGEGGLSGEALTLWREASACAYFSLTLLEVFGAPDFESRRALAALKGRDGEPQRLAEARLELAVSPHSTRIMLDDIRLAWELPLRLP
ncbi:P-loop NTPase fold protein [Kitasatospora sp. NPDC058965]|uniref:P-loop NTPase fold protein n=1 Tax=Kitasatospora sp. NPDC058965 TaxID=3346682 RepID=UPI0036C25AB5